MNQDQIAGETKNLTGQVKEGFGKLTGEGSTEAAGVADQLSGTVQKGVGDARSFAKKRPYAAAALVGVIGLALLNTLRGKKAN